LGIDIVKQLREKGDKIDRMVVGDTSVTMEEFHKSLMCFFLDLIR
jgi:hypothetical protein